MSINLVIHPFLYESSFIVHPCDKSAKGGCTQICAKDGEGLKCECQEGYKLNEDGKTCDIGKFDQYTEKILLIKI